MTRGSQADADTSGVGTMVLEHYREPAGWPFGDGGGEGFDLAPASCIHEALRTARTRGIPAVALQGPLLNPGPSHAETLASAFREHGGELLIRVARWSPQGTCAGVLDLLKRVSRLEMDYPSCGSEARRLFRVVHPHEAFVAALADLRAHAIDPVVCIWVGVPGDDRETLLETLRRVYSLRPRRVQLRTVVVPPGCYLDLHRVRLGLTVDATPPHHVLGHRTAGPLAHRLALSTCRTSAGGYNAWMELAERAGGSDGTST